jgi:hypothetical protein
MGVSGSIHFIKIYSCAQCAMQEKSMCCRDVLCLAHMGVDHTFLGWSGTTRHKISNIHIRLQWFFKFAMPQVFLDREKISKTILEKVFIFMFGGFFLIWVFVSKNLKIALLRVEIFFLK